MLASALLPNPGCKATDLEGEMSQMEGKFVRTGIMRDENGS